jgi:RNase P/RNase MRP subunit p30
MRFFDLVCFQDESVADTGVRLGFRKVFVSGRDVGVVEEYKSGQKYRQIIRSDDIGRISKALRQGDVIGMMPQSSSVSRKTLDTIMSNEKALFLPLRWVTCSDRTARIQNLAKARTSVRNALVARVPISIVSMAESGDELISSLQMIEVAGFLGLERERAKSALSLLGGLL